MGVFPDLEVGAEIDAGAFCGVELVVGGEGDDGLVADAVAVYDESVWKCFDDFAPESCDHGLSIWGKGCVMQVVSTAGDGGEWEKKMKVLSFQRA